MSSLYRLPSAVMAADSVSWTVKAGLAESTAVKGVIIAESALLHDRMLARPGAEPRCIGHVVAFPTQHAAIRQATASDRRAEKSAIDGAVRSASASR